MHAGAGGVGHIGIQLAKAKGARVATTVSNQEKSDIAKACGADEIIFYKDESVAEYVERLTEGKGFDVVFDTIGGENLDRSFDAVKHYGQVSSIIGGNTHDLGPMQMRSSSLHMIFMLLPMITGVGRDHHGQIMQDLAQMVDAGKIKPHLHDQHFTFDQANDAHALFESGKHMGKIVLENL